MDIIKVVINAGHTKTGNGSGAVAFLNESVETRKMAYQVMALLADTSHEVIPAVFDKHENNLKAAVEVSNNNNADLFVSIHFNAGGGHGCEVYTYKGKQLEQAQKACKALSSVGFTDRGVKDGSGLYVLKNTKCKALLIEICFVDNSNDAKLYKKYKNKVAEAIFNSIK